MKGDKRDGGLMVMVSGKEVASRIQRIVDGIVDRIVASVVDKYTFGGLREGEEAKPIADEVDLWGFFSQLSKFSPREEIREIGSMESDFIGAVKLLYNIGVLDETSLLYDAISHLGIKTFCRACVGLQEKAEVEEERLSDEEMAEALKRGIRIFAGRVKRKVRELEEVMADVPVYEGCVMSELFMDRVGEEVKEACRRVWREGGVFVGVSLMDKGEVGGELLSDMGRHDVNITRDGMFRVWKIVRRSGVPEEFIEKLFENVKAKCELKGRSSCVCETRSVEEIKKAAVAAELVSRVADEIERNVMEEDGGVRVRLLTGIFGMDMNRKVRGYYGG